MKKNILWYGSCPGTMPASNRVIDQASALPTCTYYKIQK